MEGLVNPSPDFWRGRSVLITGDTGFKGSWLSLWLNSLGAKVIGFALAPNTEPSLYRLAFNDHKERQYSDIRNLDNVCERVKSTRPEIVFHMAAQSLVRPSYQDPVETYATNVMGTAHVLESIRRTPSVRAVVSVTTDKCYDNKEWVWPYRETDPLGGYDPYSSSKACAEIVSAAYRSSYFSVERIEEHHVALATARAGNVIGGGDWSEDRLVPDLIRGFQNGSPARIRRPKAIRPWQHVLELVHGYTLLAEHLLTSPARFASAFNFGPTEDDTWPVEKIANEMVELWGRNAAWVRDSEPGVHEAGYLKLDTSKARAHLEWKPRLRIKTALEWTIRWYKQYEPGMNMQQATLEQIAAYRRLA